ncbi:MAG: type V CRISPR-associated protein Cas4 [Candidatus Diapherotrites archaeon]
MEENIPISSINDFLFCPRSIYFHNLYKEYDEHVYHSFSQLQGRISHKSIDEKKYTTSKHVLQAISVYNEELGIFGKIDLFDQKKGILVERKHKIKMTFEGYLLQIYAQYFCLVEMGFSVKEIRLYSVSDNKVYNISLPSQKEKDRLFEVLSSMRKFRLDDKSFSQNINKCKKCIYRELCDYYDEQT